MLDFTEMSVVGNNYIYINCFKISIDISSIESKILSLIKNAQKVFGDGVVFVMPSIDADAKMIVYNTNGRETEICGCELFSVGKYLYEQKIVPKEEMAIETKSGIKKIRLTIKENLVEEVSVNIGKPSISAEAIPVIAEKNVFINEPLEIIGRKYSATCISMGNPHAVIFTEALDSINVELYGVRIQGASIFPEGINVEFAEIIDKKHIKVRTWERGVGETLSSGIGACATVVAATINNLVEPNTDIEVELEGGILNINYSLENGVVMNAVINKVNNKTYKL